MDEQWSLERWGTRVQQAARAFPYPPTPNNMANAVKRRLATRPARPVFKHQRLAWAVAAALAIVFLAALPAAQSRLLDLIGLGAGRATADVTPTLLSPTLTVTGLPSPTSMLLTATPQPLSTPLSSAQTRAELPPYPFAPVGRID
jgi:hypothetical protein